MEQKAKNVSPFSSESRNAYVIGHITEAMLSLLRDKPVHEITVSELCVAAGVGRTSFYRNFETKEDIIRAHIRKLSHGWADKLKKTPGLPFHEAIRQVFSHLEEHREFYGLLYERGLIDLLKDILLDLCGFAPEQEVVAAYASAYVAFLLYGWIEVWLRRGMRETAEELAEYLEAGVKDTGGTLLPRNDL